MGSYQHLEETGDKFCFVLSRGIFTTVVVAFLV
jgi:hypothetical protein